MMKLPVGEIVISEQKTTQLFGEKGMWDFGYNKEAMINLRDSVHDIVKGQSRSGLYIDLKVENDIDDHDEIVPAFGYWTGRLPVGTKVMCTIIKPAREDKDILVSVDSVVYEDEMAA